MLYLTYYNLLIMIRGKPIYKLTSFSNCIYNSNLYNLCENVVVVGNKSFVRSFGRSFVRSPNTVLIRFYQYAIMF